MEIKVKKDNEIITIKAKEINGILGKDNYKFLDILNNSNKYPISLIVDKKNITKKEINDYKTRISIIKDKDINYFQNTIYECMYYEIRRKKLALKNPKKKIMDSLKIVGLDTSLLNRNINTLSSSEEKLIKLSIALLSNPELIVIEEPFKYLDKINEKELIMFFQKIIDRYNKTVVFISNDSEMLYQYSTHLIIAQDNKILIEGNTKDIFKKVDFLKENKIQIPEIVEFTDIVRKKKKVKLDYHKDIRDIIKDIYKHV